MDPAVAAVIAAAAALIAIMAYVKASAAERRAREAETRVDEALQGGADKPLARKALRPAERAEPESEAAAESEPAPESEPEPESEPAPASEPSPSPSPAVPEAEEDPAVVARAEEMFRDAHALARQLGFDFRVEVGDQEGYRVTVDESSELDTQAIAYLQEHEERILEVRRKDNKTQLIVHP